MSLSLYNGGKISQIYGKMQSLKLVVLSVKILIILYMAADTQSIKNTKQKPRSKETLKSSSNIRTGIRARICKRLGSSGIDSRGSIPPLYVAWRLGT